MSSLDQEIFEAISNADIKGVKMALNKGANVDAAVRDFMKLPIWLYQMEVNDSYKYAFPIYNAIWNVIIPQAKSILDPYVINKHMTNFNRVFSLNNIEGASTVVLAAIKKTNGSVRIDVPEIFSILGDDKDPYHVARTKRRVQIFETHRLVAERLVKPYTEFEKSIEKVLHGNNRRYWMEPLKFPPLELLPMPTEEFVKAREQLYHATHDILGFTKAMRETSEPHKIKQDLKMARSQSTFALKRIEALQEKRATSVWKLRLM